MKTKTDKRDIPTYYAIIPSEVRYCNSIPAGARLLFGEINCLSNKDGYCWASNEFFEKLYNVHQTTISEWVKQLEDNNFIKVIVKGNKRKITILSTLRKKTCLDKKKDLSLGKEKDLNNNTSNNTIIYNNTAEAESVNFNSKEYLENIMKGSNKLHSIVAVFALFKKKVFKDKKSANAFLFSGFNLRYAKELIEFDNKDILKAMKKCDEYIINGRKVDWSLKAVVNAINK